MQQSQEEEEETRGHRFLRPTYPGRRLTDRISAISIDDNQAGAHKRRWSIVDWRRHASQSENAGPESLFLDDLKYMCYSSFLRAEVMNRRKQRLGPREVGASLNKALAACSPQPLSSEPVRPLPLQSPPLGRRGPQIAESRAQQEVDDRTHQLSSLRITQTMPHYYPPYDSQASS